MEIRLYEATGEETRNLIPTMPINGAAVNGGSSTAKKKPKPQKPPPPSSLNPNWATLQQKLNPHGRRRSPYPDAQTLILGKRKRTNSEEEEEGEEEATTDDILTPTSDDVSLTEELAMDCEMVGVSPLGTKNALGRIALVNSWGNVVYDEYVRPLERVVDFRTHISGIHPKNLWNAKNFLIVQKKVAELIRGRVLVGHALHNDLKVLLLSHPKKDIRDTASYLPFLSKEGRKRSLKDLAAQVLGVRIQQNEHCPVQDARAAMLIYKKYKKEWEKSIKKQDMFKMKLKKKRRKKGKKIADSGVPSALS